MTTLAAEMTAQATVAPQIQRRHVAAAVVGNWLEFYDFVVYTYFAIQIGDAFFPTATPFQRLMASLVTFGIGFIARPLGALVFGRFADRVGRRPAMLASFFLMGAALTGFVLTPGYRQIGMAAPLLAIVCRLVQGFALGGEVGPTTAFLIEAAPLGKRGLYGAWQSSTQSLASIAAGGLGLVAARFLSAADMHDWGWRVALGLGVLVLPFGMIVRRTLPETLHHAEPKLDVHSDHDSNASQLAVIAGHWRVVLIGVGIIAGATISTYVFTYMTTYAQQTLHMGIRTGLEVAVTNGAGGFLGSMAGGWLSDRYGRRPLMIWPRVAFLLMIWPAFALVVKVREPALLLTLMALLNVVANLALVPAFVALVESLRKDIRGVATGATYAITVAVFGATTQPAVAWLEHVTGNPLAIAWYLMAGALAGLIAAILMPETVRRGARG
jgi:MFS family permease